MGDEGLSTLTEVARRWRMSPRTLQRWVRDGLPGTREPIRFRQYGPRKVLFSPSDIAHTEAALARSVSRSPRGNRRSVTP